MATVTIMSSVSICLYRSVLWLNDALHTTASVWISQYKVSHRNTILQLSTPSYSPPLRNSEILLIYYISLSWPFCLWCYEHGRALLSRWSLIDVPYAVWSAISANTRLLVHLLQVRPPRCPKPTKVGTRVRTILVLVIGYWAIFTDIG